MNQTVIRYEEGGLFWFDVVDNGQVMISRCFINRSKRNKESNRYKVGIK